MDKKIYTIEDIAIYLCSETIIGDKSITVENLSGISDIGKGSIVCAAKKNDVDIALKSKAVCVVLKDAIEDRNGKSIIVVQDTTEAFARLLDLFFKDKQYPYGVIETSAFVSESAKISSKAYIAHNVVIGDNSVIGENTAILSNTVIGDNVIIGDNCKINPNVVLNDNTVLEDNIIIGSSSVIGGDGFGYYAKDNIHNKISQRGNVIIGHDTEIGSSVMIDKAVIGSTKIGSGVKIDNLVHIAHNCSIGDHTLIIAQVGIAGSTKIGNWCTLAGQAGIADHVEIGDNVIIAAQGGVVTGVKIDDASILFGTPAQDITREKMCIISYRKLPEIVEEIENITGKRIKPKKM